MMADQNNKGAVSDQSAIADVALGHRSGSVQPVAEPKPPNRENGARPMSPALPKEYYKRFMSSLSENRHPSAIRSILHLEQTPGLISFLSGKPAAATFPFTSFTVTIRDPIDPSKEEALTITGKLLEDSLQYTDTRGMHELLEWLHNLQEHFHGRKRGEGWRISMGAGSQDSLYKAFLALLSPADVALVEAPVYSGVIPILKSTGCELVEIETDGNGIMSSSLREVLQSWPAGKPKPKLLYTVPYGCNPTGATATEDRKREVLALAREHDFLIFEDDPYYYLYYGDATPPMSYFAMEALDGKTTGHVVRFDSFSKILSSGIRVGFTSGPEPILNAIDMHTGSANLQVSSLTQAITYTLLSHWGIPGFTAHVKNIGTFYRYKRDVFETAMNKHLSGLADWVSPVSGMFLWFKLRLPPSNESPEGDSEQLIKTKALEHGVLALPGAAFFANSRKTAYVRCAFSMVSEEEVDEGLRRLSVVVKEEQAKIKS